MRKLTALAAIALLAATIQGYAADLDWNAEGARSSLYLRRRTRARASRPSKSPAVGSGMMAAMTRSIDVPLSLSEATYVDGRLSPRLPTSPLSVPL
jgi:hypothetical protein